VPIYPPFQHSKNDVIISADKPHDFCSLLIGQAREVWNPTIAGFTGYFGDDSMHGSVELLIDSEYKFPEVG
jgi:hypothetical protein